MQTKTIPLIMATTATRPIVRPTAPPVDKPPLLDFDTGAMFCEFGGTVGVIVTVLIDPGSVSRETVGVGVQVRELDDELDDALDGEAEDWKIVGVMVVAGAIAVEDVGYGQLAP